MTVKIDQSKKYQVWTIDKESGNIFKKNYCSWNNFKRPLTQRNIYYVNIIRELNKLWQ